MKHETAILIGQLFVYFCLFLSVVRTSYWLYSSQKEQKEHNETLERWEKERNEFYTNQNKKLKDENGTNDFSKSENNSQKK